MDRSNIPAHPTKNAVYASQQIVERRKTILAAARQLITDQGIDGVSIRELSQLAGVSQRTLYNAFHSKDRIMALAIREAYDEMSQRGKYYNPTNTLDGRIERLASFHRRNLRARSYTRAIVSIYFSSTVTSDIFLALRDIASTNTNIWLEEIDRAGDIPNWTSAAEISDTLANIEYSVINDWSNERISDDDYVLRLLFAVLSFVAGVTCGETQRNALAYLESIAESGEIPSFPKRAA